MEFYAQLRQRMIDIMQISLRQIRQVLGYGVQEFGDMIGLTRQSINNLESCKNKMSAVQYVAICSVIDSSIQSQPDLLSVIISILNANDIYGDKKAFEIVEGDSFLKKWFLCFSEDSRIVKLISSDSADSDPNGLEKISENCRIFLDETALCEMQLVGQTAMFVDMVGEKGRKFIIPLKSVEAIQFNLISSDGENTLKARSGMNMLTVLQDRGLAEIRGEKNDVNVMATLVSVFVKFKVVNRLALITQNRNLAKKILSLNNDEIGGFEIIVLYCCRDGSINKWDFSDISDHNEEYDYNSSDDDIPEYDEEYFEAIAVYEEKTEAPADDSASPELSGWEEI